MLWRTIRTTDVMMHSSSFLLPKLHHPANKPVMNYALVVLNQQLPRFMPRLWDHGNSSLFAFLS
jgi:thiamine pyrophosphokinase